MAKAKGRPSKYNPALHPTLVGYIARLYISDEEIAAQLNITEQTLNNWKKEHKDFFASLKKGKADRNKQVENALFKRCLGYEYEEKVYRPDENGKQKLVEVKVKRQPPSDVAIIYFLNNRDPENWSNKNYHEHAGEIKTGLTEKTLKIIEKSLNVKK